MTALATAYVRLRVDGRALPGEIKQSVTAAAGPAGTAAGKTAGSGFSKSFGTTATAGAKKAGIGIDGALARGAVTSGLGYGKRFGVSMRDTIGTYAKQTGALMLGFLAFEKVKDLFGEVVSQGQSAAKAQALTEAAIKSTGGVANVTADDVASLAKRLSEMSGIEDDTVRSSANLLLTFRNVRDEVGQGNLIFDRAETSILNIAQAMAGAGGSDGVDSLKGATIQVGKALNDPIRGLTLLQRVGVAFTDQQKKQITQLVENNHLLGAQKIVLGELRAEFGGAAASQALWSDKAGAAFANMEQELGLKLLPLFEDVSQWFATDGIAGLRAFGSGVDTYAIPPLRELVSAGGDVIGMFDDLPSPVKSGVVQVGLLALGVRLLTPAFVAAGAAGDRAFTSVASNALYASTIVAGAETKLAGFGQAALTAGKNLVFSKTGALGFAVGLQVLDSAVGDTDKGLHSLLTVGSDVALGFAVGGPWGAALGAGVGILQLFGEAHKQAAADAQAFQDTLDQSTGAVTRETASLIANKAAAAGLSSSTDALGISQRDIFDALLQGGSAYDRQVASLKALIDAHTVYKPVGKAFTQGLDEQGQAAQKALDFLEGMKGGIDDGTASWRTNKAANDAANAALRGTSRDAHLAGISLKEARAQVVSLDDALKGLDATLSDRASLRDYKAALDAARKAEDSNIDITKENTDKQREAQAVFDAVSAAAVKHAQAMKDDGASIQAQRKFLQGSYDDLVQIAKGFDTGKLSAKQYTSQVLDIPPKVITQLRLLGADSAAATLIRIRDVMQAIRNGANISINVNTGDIGHLAAGDYRPSQFRTGSQGPVLWNETGKGESYISHDPRYRQRSLGILAKTAQALGAKTMAAGSVPNVPIPQGASDDMKAVLRALNSIRFGLAADAGAVHDEFAGLIQAVRKALGADSPLVSRLAGVAADAVDAASDRAQVIDKLSALEDARKQLVSGARQSFTADPFTAAHTAQGLIAFEKDAVARVRRFLRAENKLLKEGFTPALIKQLIGDGPDAVDAAVALANAPARVRRQFERLANQQRRLAGNVGEHAARSLLDPQIREARQERDQLTHEIRILLEEVLKLIRHRAVPLMQVEHQHNGVTAQQVEGALRQAFHKVNAVAQRES